MPIRNETLRLHARAALDLLWPPICPRCGARAEHPQEQYCERCWGALREHGGTESVLAAFVVDSLFLDLLAASKYRRDRAVGKRLAREATARLAKRVPDGVLVPVPLTRAKRRERGFNQSEDFALALSRHTRRGVEPGWLRRVRGGRALAGCDKAEREKRVRGAFSVPPGLPIEGLDLIVVDDVITTGATSAACTAALEMAGGRVVAVVGMGRAGNAGDDVPPASRELLARL